MAPVPSPTPSPSPPNYDITNTFLTVISVFAFFGLCILIVATWLRCVVGIEGYSSVDHQRSSSNRLPARRDRKRRRRGGDDGFQEWLRRRRSNSAPGTPTLPLLPPFSPPPPPPLPRTIPPSLLLDNGGAGMGYNTFSMPQWTEPLSSSSDGIGVGPRRLSGSPGARDAPTKRTTWTLPASSSSKVSKPGRRRGNHMRRKSTGSAGSNGSSNGSSRRDAMPRQLIRSMSANAADRSGYGSRGLYVVVEETGTSTP